MICPYNRKSEICTKQSKNDFINEENNIVRGIAEGYIVKFELMQCPKEECGAWQNDRCNYNQGHNSE